MAGQITRRALLRHGLALAGAAAAETLDTTADAAPQGPVTVGLVTALTGVFAANGRDEENGLAFALRQVVHRVAGREIRLVIEDDQGAPGQTLAKARKLVELDKVDLLMGPLTSASGYALRDYVDQQRIPAVYFVAADDLTQRKRSPWIVRTSYASSQPMHPFGVYAAKTLRYARVAAIAFDFSFGWECVGGFQTTFEASGGRVVEHLWPPLGAPDYGPYLARIPRNIDAVCAVFSGGDALRFLDQYRAFGLMGRIPLIGMGTLTDEHVLFEEGELAKGIVTALHYSPALGTPASRAFVRAYAGTYHRVPSYYSEIAYTAAQFMIKGLQAVAGRLENRQAFVAAMQKVELTDAPRGPVRLDAWGNPVNNIYVRRVDIVNGQPQNTVIYTYPHVSQFWTFDPAEYLKRPLYTRDVPPVHP
jgi:branched-chain amino acid transport system substrate-binding protein